MHGKGKSGLVGHRPLGGQAKWQDQREIGQVQDITVYHVTAHVPLVTPGNEEVDALLHVRWLGKAPATDVIAARRCQNMWTVKQQRNLPLKKSRIPVPNAWCAPGIHRILAT